MERRFLKIIIFTGLLITSCQQIPINESNKKFVGDNIDKQNLEIDLKKQEKNMQNYNVNTWISQSWIYFIPKICFRPKIHLKFLKINLSYLTSPYRIL